MGVHCVADGLWNNGPGVEVRVTPQSAAASRSMLWLSVLRAETPMQLTFMLNGNSWAQPEQRGDGGWLQTIAVPQFQAEVKMLAPSLLPIFGSATDPHAQATSATVFVETATILQPNAGPSKPIPASAGFAVLAKAYSEECGASTNSSGLCTHIVVVNQFRYGPVTFTLRVQLDPAPSTSPSECAADYCSGFECPQAIALGTPINRSSCGVGVSPCVCTKALPVCAGHIPDHQWGTCMAKGPGHV